MKDAHTIVCDGGKKTNMTYGSFKVFSPEGKEIVHIPAVFGFGTSNTAEYMAFINAINYCNRNKIKRVLFKSDSLLMINQVKGKWRTMNSNLIGLKRIVLDELKKLDEYQLVKIHNKEVKKILGH